MNRSVEVSRSVTHVRGQAGWGAKRHDGAIVAKFQEAEQDYLMHSEAGSRTMAKNHVGLPLDFSH